MSREYFPLFCTAQVPTKASPLFSVHLPASRLLTNSIVQGDRRLPPEIRRLWQPLDPGQDLRPEDVREANRATGVGVFPALDVHGTSHG